MRFKEYLIMEQDPLGGGMGAPLGAPPADPMGGAGAPPADPMGGMGGDPMGGMGMEDPMGGGEPQTQPIPTHADVWDVLDSILNNKEIEKVKPAQIVEPPQAGGGMGGPPMDPMGGMGGDPMMGGGAPPPMGGDMGGGAAPAGGGGPFLQG